MLHRKRSKHFKKRLLLNIWYYSLSYYQKYIDAVKYSAFILENILSSVLADT